MTTLGIIGAGLTGLTIAYRRMKAGDQVIVFEASSRLGGQLHTETSGEFVVELGAEGFVAESRAFQRLAQELDIETDIIAQSVRDSCAFDGKELIRLKPGEAGQRLGFQVSPRAFGKGIESLRRGMQQVIEALVAQLSPHVTILTEHAVTSVARTDAGWRVSTPSGPFEVEQLVIAAPAVPAAGILHQLEPEAARDLGLAQCTSSVTVSMAFSGAHVDCSPDVSGFIVAEQAQQNGFRACSYSSIKLSPRSPKEQLLLRVFLRPTELELKSFSDDQWAQRAFDLLSTVHSVSGKPSRSWVSRWNSALPQFDAQHVARVSTLEKRLEAHGVVLAGAAFHGSGIDGALRSAEAATEKLANS